jgi:hypothetical protein
MLRFRQWCRARGLSLSSGYKIRNQGQGPHELQIPGLRGTWVTPEADAEWEQRAADFSASEEGRREATRRREIAAAAGRIAAESPKHVSKRIAGRARHSQRRTRS